MNTNTEYNGWTNYETWLVKLWMDNDQGSQEYWTEQAKENPYRAPLAERLKDFHLAEAQDTVTQNGVLCDLLNAAISSVNWYEIADSLIDDLQENDDETEE